jgi:hypothetical protein
VIFVKRLDIWVANETLEFVLLLAHVFIAINTLQINPQQKKAYGIAKTMYINS